jgi:hypothetical protein
VSTRFDALAGRWFVFRQANALSTQPPDCASADQAFQAAQVIQSEASFLIPAVLVLAAGQIVNQFPDRNGTVLAEFVDQ